MEFKYFIVITTVLVIHSEHRNVIAKPVSTLENGKKVSDCISYNSTINENDLDSGKCRFVGQMCTPPELQSPCYKPSVCEQYFKMEKDGIAVPSGCRCSKPRRKDTCTP